MLILCFVAISSYVVVIYGLVLERTVHFDKYYNCDTVFRKVLSLTIILLFSSFLVHILVKVWGYELVLNLSDRQRSLISSVISLLLYTFGALTFVHSMITADETMREILTQFEFVCLIMLFSLTYLLTGDKLFIILGGLSVLLGGIKLYMFWYEWTFD